MANDSEWRNVQLGEIAEVTVGYVGPMVSEYGDSGIPFLRSQNVLPYRIDLTNVIHITESFHRKLAKSALSPGDVVIVRTGKPGTAAVVPDRLPVANCSDLVVVRPGPQLNSRFLVYYLNSLAQHHIDAYTVGAVQQHFNIGSARAMLIPVPPLAEQRAIARILGSLDDKIALNRRMNRTLEELAEAIFKSWFVDFDPVVARAEGRQPFGMDAETAALFPAAFEESKAGPVPAGWRVGTIGDIGRSLRRGVQPNQLDPSTPYLGLEHMPQRSIALTEWGQVADVVSGKAAFRKGEILFGKLRPYFHKVGVAPLDGVCSTDIVVLNAQRSEWFGLLLGHLSSVDFINFVNASSEGTRMPRTSWGEMARYQIVIPSPEIGARYSTLVTPLLAKIHAGIFESRTLATLRDALLPKLMSGEIRVG